MGLRLVENGRGKEGVLSPMVAESGANKILGGLTRGREWVRERYGLSLRSL